MSDLKYLDFQDKMLAVAIRVDGAEWIVRGTAEFVKDSNGRRELKVLVEPIDEAARLVIDQDLWDGQIHPDKKHGCDFLLELNA